MRSRFATFAVSALLAAALSFLWAYGAPAQIYSIQKISETDGGFTGSIGASGQFGRGAARIGLVDGDTIPDIVVGEPFSDVVWVLFLNADGTVKAHQKLGSPALPTATRFGDDVAGIGDVDGDGVPDIAIGGPLGDDGGTNRGDVWIFLLQTDGTVKSFQKISDTEGNFSGTLDDFDNFGSSVAGLGDVDGDLVPDIAVGAIGDDDGGSNNGAVWILFLNADGTVKGHTKISETQGGFGGALAGQFWGGAVSLLGDIDGDGNDDLAVGEPNASAVWILFLDGAGGVLSEIRLADGQNGLGSDVTGIGRSVAWLGDINGDGYGELLTGSISGGPQPGSTGRAWYLTLDTDGSVLMKSEITLLFEGLNSGDSFGQATANAGDIDGDGLVDIVVGAPGDFDGAVYIGFSASCAADPYTYNYGAVQVGEFSDHEFWIRNPTDSLVTGTIVETCDAYQIIAGGGAYSLPAGDSLSFTVRFQPLALGAAYRCVIDAGCVLVGVIGLGGQPEITVSPTALYHTTGVFTSVLDSVSVYNTGFADLDWQVHTNAHWISVDPDTGVTPFLVKDWFYVTLSADSLLPGAYVDTVFVTSDDLDEPSTPVIVHFNVLGPDISISATSLTYPQTVVGNLSPLGVSIRNFGNYDLVGSASVATEDYVVVGGGSIDVAPGDSTFLTVRFLPLSTGVKSDTLTVASNDPDELLVYVALSGTAVSPPDIAASPDTLYAVLPPGGTTPRTITVSNVGVVDASVQLVVKASGMETMSRVFLPDPPAPVWATSGAGPAPMESAAMPAHPILALPFVENFEDGDFMNWMLGPGSATREVTGVTAANGSGFSYHESNSTQGHGTGIYYDMGPVNPYSVSFWVRTASTSEYASYFTLRDSGLREAIFFFAQANGQFYCNANVGGHDSYSYVQGVWYHIEYRDIDFTSKNFDYYVDGNLVQADIPFRNAADVSDLSRVELYNFSAGTEGWWDEIIISDEVPAPWVTLNTPFGTIPANGELDFDVTINADTLAAGVYHTDVDVLISGPGLLTLLDEVHVKLRVDSTVTGVPGTPESPADYALLANRPNPFNPVTQITYDLPRASRVRLDVFDVRGRRVRTLVSGIESFGRKTVTFDGRDERGQPLASGVYFYRLRAGDFEQTRKMILLK